MKITKQNYAGAVTCLQFDATGEWLYVVTGSTLYVYHTTNCEIHATLSLLDEGIIHGMDAPLFKLHCDASVIPFGVFYGQKQLSFIAQEHTTCSEWKLRKIFETRRKDWILCVQILTQTVEETTLFPLIAIGYAHNFVDIYSSHQRTTLMTFQSSAIGILYSMSIYGRSLDTLRIATGTVTRSIIIWKLPGTYDENDRSAISVQPTQRLDMHNGAVFRIIWSEDGKQFISVSEDRTMQLCSINTEQHIFESKIRAWGHHGRLWDACFTQQGIATASEDGICKLWDVEEGQCIATLQGHVGKHIWRVTCHPNKRLIATGGGDGAVKLWDTYQHLHPSHTLAIAEQHNINLRFGEISQRGQISKRAVAIRDVLIGRDRGYCVADNGEIHALDIEKSQSQLLWSPFQDGVHMDATASVSCTCMDPQKRYLAFGNSSGWIYIFGISDNALVASWKAVKARILRIWWHSNTAETDQSTIFTSSVDRKLVRWRILRGTEGTLHWKRLESYGINTSKSAISSLQVVEQMDTTFLIAGDGNGTICTFSCTHHSVDQELIEPASIFKSVHGREYVSCITAIDGDRILTGGHDGYYNTFLMCFRKDDLVLSLLTRHSIKGMGTISKFSWNHQRQELLVFGFQASHAILYNVTRQYRLFHLDCGGWRRPHAMYIPLTSNALVDYTLLFCTREQKKHTRTALELQSVSSKGSMALNACSFHHQFHGRMITSAMFLDSNTDLVTGSEDNQLQLHVRAPIDNLWRRVAIGVAHTSAIRAISKFSLHDETIVLTAGGKQTVNAWKVSRNPYILRHICTSEKSDVQEHRILGLASFSLQHDRYRLVITGNSEGVIACILLDLTHESFSEIGEFSASLKPILCLSALQITSANRKIALLATGSTDGMIHVWDFSSLLETLSTEMRQITSNIQLSPCYSYVAHEMGTNTLTLVQPQTEAASMDQMVVSVCSAGDDQSVRVRDITFSAQSHYWTTAHDAHIPHASGSAIKALYSNGQVLLIAGYDQRLSVYAMNPIVWKASVISECADVSALDVHQQDAEKWDVVIAGDGFQTFTLDFRE
uniref:Uncharacterized protein AlNc14C301G10377 n=1 Tax=Albugo laibachii Nc14 TaxID=890382 RepID=F0WVN9_9STRA|nr:conserved hypothetical protein [Albugo laibachii Nc14]|eukprot:CCA25484.1 conserved hypothetical protein [Albugo laibachii Nc14]